MAKEKTFKLGEFVKFGRPNGEKTLGKVIKVNRKTITVETMETRGRGRGGVKGARWRVHPSLVYKADQSQTENSHDRSDRAAADDWVELLERQVAAGKMTAEQATGLLKDAGIL